jgi:hypothetical protein
LVSSSAKPASLKHLTISSKELTMKYTLILKTGQVMVFTVKACADLYQTIYGGTLVTENIFAKSVPATETVV